MTSEFKTNINKLMQIKVRTIKKIIICGICGLLLLVFLLIMNYLSIAYISLFVLFIFLILTSLGLNLKIYNYYQRISQSDNYHETKILLEKTIEEAEKLKNHWFLKRQAKYFIKAYQAFQQGN